MFDCSLYLISPPQIADAAAFGRELEAALSTGLVRSFQLRLKEEDSGVGIQDSERVRDEGRGQQTERAFSPAPLAAQERGQGANTKNSGVRIRDSNSRLTLPHASRDTILNTSAILRPICHAHNAAFIINDSPEIAHEAGADGVHLGQEDGAVEMARTLLGEEAVIGVSCHASRHLAMEAGEQGADYVAFGAFYPTRSKSSESLEKWGTPTPDILEWWATHTVLPCVAIGGITPENASPLVAAGADFLAVLSYVWSHPQGARAGVETFRDVLEK